MSTTGGQRGYRQRGGNGRCGIGSQQPAAEAKATLGGFMTGGATRRGSGRSTKATKSTRAAAKPSKRGSSDGRKKASARKASSSKSRKASGSGRKKSRGSSRGRIAW